MIASSNNKNIATARTDPRETFPQLLHRMLTEINDMASKDASMAYLKEIISWQEHGMAFKIHDKNRFTNIVMPIYFSRLKYSSFIRQTNLFGFKRINSEGPDKGCYFHEMFVRDMPEMAKSIEKVKKNKKQNEMANELEFKRILSRSQSAPMVGQHSLLPQPTKPAHFHSSSLPSSPAHAPVAMTSLHSMMMPSEGSLRDMLLPILPSTSNSSNFPAFPFGEETANSDFNPFAHLWNTLDDNEPLPLSSCNPNTWDDLEPLSLFP